MEHKKNKHIKKISYFVNLVCTQPAFKWIVLFKTIVDPVQKKNTIVLAASTHNLFDKSFSCNIHLVIPRCFYFSSLLHHFVVGGMTVQVGVQCYLLHSIYKKRQLHVAFALLNLIIFKLQPL